MTDLASRKCVPCKGDTPPLPRERAEQLLAELAGWSLDDDGTAIRREFKFKNFLRTMAFVNAVAWISLHENHHPDVAFCYDACTLTYTTHAIGGLSDNDFICAAKVDGLTAD